MPIRLARVTKLMVQLGYSEMRPMQGRSVVALIVRNRRNRIDFMRRQEFDSKFACDAPATQVLNRGLARATWFARSAASGGCILIRRPPRPLRRSDLKHSRRRSRACRRYLVEHRRQRQAVRFPAASRGPLVQRGSGHRRALRDGIPTRRRSSHGFGCRGSLEIDRECAGDPAGTVAFEPACGSCNRRPHPGDPACRARSRSFQTS